ncbi:DUF371 domain-containing protein [Methanospirillum sp.]|nr:DUF371 domain-containing protein [Methanospirillum sp.]HOL41864.1 DUF371 domain-containing protein [Methanospirillum sp.]HPP78022.1 DUF371 domain-containing protein [Methanospirillum sp.]
MVREEEYLTACGHPNITANHRTTFEITKEHELSLAGSCIIAVGSDKGALDLSRRFRDILQHPGSRLITTLTCGPYMVQISSQGDPGLSLTHPTDLVWRRSAYTCNRTIGVFSDHTARDLPREMIHLLARGAELEVVLVAEYTDGGSGFSP